MKCVLVETGRLCFLQNRYVGDRSISQDGVNTYSRITEVVSVELSKTIDSGAKWEFFEYRGGTSVWIEALIEIVKPAFFEALAAGLRTVSPEWVICFESSYSDLGVIEGFVVSEELSICVNSGAARRMTKKHRRYFEVYQCE